jgi:hypothetical protein
LIPELLVDSKVPPDAAEYHLNVPLTVDSAPSVTEPVPHLLEDIAVTEDDNT